MILKVGELSKRFGKKIALRPTSFELENGIIGLLGPNGAGKTTLLRLLSTYYAPDSGNISLNGMDWNKNTEKVRKMIGYLPQYSGGFPNLTAKEYLRYMGSLRGIASKRLEKDIPQVLRQVNLEEKAHARIKSLSGGMKQRLGIAQAIIHQPTVLLVDEPTAGLDPEERIRFRNLIKQLGKDRIVLISTHITEDITMTCDRILLMQAGSVEPYSSINEVTDFAEGMVWRLDTDTLTYERMQENPNILITQILRTDQNGVSMRYIAPEQFHPEATSAKPVLEEGYMVWLKKR